MIVDVAVDVKKTCVPLSNAVMFKKTCLVFLKQPFFMFLSGYCKLLEACMDFSSLALGIEKNNEKPLLSANNNQNKC